MRRGDGSGSEVSLRQLLEHVDVERLIRDELLEPRVLAFEFLQPLRVVGIHAPVLRDPSMPRRLRDLEMPTHLVEFSAGRQELVALRELPDDRVGRMPPSRHGRVLLTPSLGQRTRTTTGP